MLSCVGRSRHRRENPAMRQTTTRAVCLILCLAGSGRAALDTNLGAFSDAIQSVATEVNDAGTVGGFSQHSTGIAMRPFRWTAETGLVQFDSAEGRPTAIDNSGMMIGFTGGSNPGPFTPGYRYSLPGPIQRIPNAGE